MKERDAAKAAELTAPGQPTSARTVTRMRLRYAERGVWGLVDQRVTRGSDLVGRADERLVTAILAEYDAQTHASTGTCGLGCACDPSWTYEDWVVHVSHGPVEPDRFIHGRPDHDVDDRVHLYGGVRRAGRSTSRSTSSSSTS